MPVNQGREHRSCKAEQGKAVMGKFYSEAAKNIAHLTGRPITFAMAVMVIVVILYLLGR